MRMPPLTVAEYSDYNISLWRIGSVPISSRTSDDVATPLSVVRCTKCGAPRLSRKDGTPGACSFIPCKHPFFDIDVELGNVSK